MQLVVVSLKSLTVPMEVHQVVKLVTGQPCTFVMNALILVRPEQPLIAAPLQRL